jgi:membrane protein implicated in regulation of membrane protease activity
MRRLLSTFVFGGAFIWVAVVFFDVPREIIWVFLVLTVVLVFSLVLAGLFGGVFLRLMRRERRSERWFNHPEADIEPGKDPSIKAPDGEQ